MTLGPCFPALKQRLEQPLPAIQSLHLFQVLFPSRGTILPFNLEKPLQMLELADQIWVPR
jgi:hypothetical protein